jgi:hypothetical protein
MTLNDLLIKVYTPGIPIDDVSTDTELAYPTSL